MSALDTIALALMTIGVAFFAAGAVGLLRFPDTCSRLHALAKADNLGLGFVAAGVLLQVEPGFSMIKLGLIWLLVMLSGAAVSQLIAQRALLGELAEEDDDRRC